jgi:cell division protein FtsL
VLPSHGTSEQKKRKKPNRAKQFIKGIKMCMSSFIVLITVIIIVIINVAVDVENTKAQD